MSYTYKLMPLSEIPGQNQTVVRSDGLNIPMVEGNGDYQTYLKWLDGYEFVNNEWVKTSDGNTPLPADE